MSETMLPAGNGAGAGRLVKDSSTRDFKADVIDESHNQPVLVDFWATWCGPCRQLTPMLEKVVGEMRGAIRLVKINVDENQALAGQMGIQSIPAVFAFKDGRPVDGFLGALPESQIRAFVERLGAVPGGSETEALLAAARDALEAGDTAGAARAFAGVLQRDAQNAEAIGGLAHCYLEMGDLDHARTTLALAGPELADKAPVASARAALRLAEQAGQVVGELPALRARVEAEPGNHQARFDLAVALNAAGDREGAVDRLIEIMRRDRNWNDDAARRQLIEFFDAWGPRDENTVAGRRKLSSLLFS